MPTSQLRRLRALPLLLVLLAAACEADGSGPSGPPVTPLLPIGDGTWYLHTANSVALPAKVSERTIGVTIEEVFVDSARLWFDNFSGSYQQRIWIRVNHTGVEDRKDFVFDEGLFSLGSGAYVLNSAVRSRTLTVTTPSATELLTAETMAFHSGADLVAGMYRRTPP